MRTDISNVYSEVVSLMEVIHESCPYVDFVVQKIESKRAHESTSVVLYMGGNKRMWITEEQRFTNSPDTWLEFSIASDDPAGAGHVKVTAHCSFLDYQVDCIEIDSRGADSALAITVELDQLTSGLWGETADYITREMVLEYLARMDNRPLALDGESK